MNTATMYIGSGDVAALMSGKDTKSHSALLQRFVSGVKPYYNAKASPIDALRTGAILEDRYLQNLPDNYFSQYVVESDDMDVFRCSIDFALVDEGAVVDFDELKSVGFDDFISIASKDEDEIIPYIKKKYKNYYYQIQEQLYCTGLPSANLVFLCVYSYDDDENYYRDIEEGDYRKVRVPRDEAAIASIKARGEIFQRIKDYYVHDK